MIVQRFIFVLIPLFVFAGARADDAATRAWCASGDYSGDHPLAWEQLQGTVTSHLQRGEHIEAHRQIVIAYEREMLIVASDPRDAQLRQAISEYLAYISDPSRQAPEVWKYVGPVGPPQNLGINFEIGPVGDLQPDTRYQMRISCEELRRSPAAQNIAYTIFALNRVSSTGLADAMQIAALKAESSYRSYRAWIMEGLAMWPWELMVNSYLVDDEFASKAPSHQWVFLRPNIAPALVGGDDESADLDHGLTLEIGHVWYRDTSYKKWWGVSAMATLTDDSGVGYGGLLRWNDYTFGVAHHPRNDDTLYYFSIDLYKYLAGDARITTLDGLVDRVKEKAKEKAKAAINRDGG